MDREKHAMSGTAKWTDGYRGRLAPSPTGLLHLGHARTFWVASERARSAGGRLVLRNDDLDVGRVRAEFVKAMIEDMRWMGLVWEEGPDVAGPHAPYSQSERIGLYRAALEELIGKGLLFPCKCSRKDIRMALGAPHAGDDEPIYPGNCRERIPEQGVSDERICWRFRVPDGEVIGWDDAGAGWQRFVAGRDFGDFVVWRSDGLPGYQLACVVDDADMRITEVVRGMDLLASTARQLLLYRALGREAPGFCHVPLVLDKAGNRLAKRHDALSLRALREQGWSPERIREAWG